MTDDRKRHPAARRREDRELANAEARHDEQRHDPAPIRRDEREWRGEGVVGDRHTD